MIFETKDHRELSLRSLNSSDFERLYHFLQHLSSETKKRFGPHPFDQPSILDFYQNSDFHRGYIAQPIDTSEIVAYAIIKFGILDGDYLRYLSYGLNLDSRFDCEFAPVVADSWQSCGIGNKLFQYILTDLKKTEVKRIILWGGVQTDNERAINYYIRNGFQVFGKFMHYGENLDMLLQI